MALIRVKRSSAANVVRSNASVAGSGICLGDPVSEMVSFDGSRSRGFAADAASGLMLYHLVEVESEGC